jgi:hypothetical protein
MKDETVGPYSVHEIAFKILLFLLCFLVYLFILYYRVYSPLTVRRVNILISGCIPCKSWRGFSLAYLLTLAVPPNILCRMGVSLTNWEGSGTRLLQPVPKYTPDN